MDAPKLMKEKQRKGTSLSKQRMMEDEVPGKEKDIWIAYLKGHEEIWGCGKTRIDAIQDLEKSIAYEKTTRN